MTVLFADVNIGWNPGDFTRFKRNFFALTADIVFSLETRFPLSSVVYESLEKKKN